MSTRARAPWFAHFLCFEPFKHGCPAVEDLASRLHEGRPASGIGPAPEGLLANSEFLGEVTSADPALQQRALGHGRPRCSTADLNLRHLLSPECRPLWANVVRQQKHRGRGGRVAVTGSEIGVYATPRATPCFIGYALNCAAVQRNLQSLQTSAPGSQRVQEERDHQGLPKLSDIRALWTTFRGGNGWQ